MDVHGYRFLKAGLSLTEERTRVMAMNNDINHSGPKRSAADALRA